MLDQHLLQPDHVGNRDRRKRHGVGTAGFRIDRSQGRKCRGSRPGRWNKSRSICRCRIPCRDRSCCPTSRWRQWFCLRRRRARRPRRRAEPGWRCSCGRSIRRRFHRPRRPGQASRRSPIGWNRIGRFVVSVIIERTSCPARNHRKSSCRRSSAAAPGQSFVYGTLVNAMSVVSFISCMSGTVSSRYSRPVTTSPLPWCSSR